MKRNIKKVAVFAMISAITMFTVAGVASAESPPIPQAIRGEYASTSAGACMIAPFGFNLDLTPIHGAAIISTSNRQQFFTFEEDGTGSVTGTGSQINLSYVGPNGPVPPSSASQTVLWDFTYTVTPDGTVTITQVPGTYFVTFTSGPNKGAVYQVEGVSFKGTITPDKKTIIFNIDASNLFTTIGPNLPPISLNQSCSSSLVLIWQHNEEE